MKFEKKETYHREVIKQGSRNTPPERCCWRQALEWGHERGRTDRGRHCRQKEESKENQRKTGDVKKRAIRWHSILMYDIRVDPQISFP